MAKPTVIEFDDGPRIRILYEDAAALAIDKPSGWILAPDSWTRTGRNLHLALMSSIQGRDFWARSRNLKYLRYVHRLDAETSGVLLFAKNPGALRALSELFETRRVRKEYWAAVVGVPNETEWDCRLKLTQVGQRTKTDPVQGQQAETHFRVLARGERTSLVEACPMTGRTHQIRVHLAANGYPVLGDKLYGPTQASGSEFGLRAMGLEYHDPFRGRLVKIRADGEEFLRRFGFIANLPSSSPASQVGVQK